jgi:hypothetical protein
MKYSVYYMISGIKEKWIVLMVTTEKAKLREEEQPHR